MVGCKAVKRKERMKGPFRSNHFTASAVTIHLAKPSNPEVGAEF